MNYPKGIYPNDPILIASPYPFNTSKLSHIECFSNDQGIILSLTIIARMLDKNISSLQYTKDNIIRNGSITLIIPTPFNYSELYSKIECRSKYHYGVQKFSELDIFSVVEIRQNEFLSISTYTNQKVTIHCLTYGTNVFISWDFNYDLSNDIFRSLPIGIRIDHKFTLNDTLIIDHVSYSDHHGYYRCYATNKLFNITYEDTSIIYLNVKKSSIWIPIVIICIVIGICILLLILCSKYCQTRKQNNQKTSEQVIENIHTPSYSDNSAQSQGSLLSSPNISSQFILDNPFLDPNVQPILLNKKYINKLQEFL
ncbi:unnamed protein product [Adineta steineri]|uniref:Ig-like domain-containing protein n=1 Tax=Adineta steineri TaxID=433720 RepID=A0A813QCA2_9BILA|nr:unnamed protein product [Adineta steineri]CAF0922254.1 unnamed protein product [Adineta steineri]